MSLHHRSRIPVCHTIVEGTERIVEGAAVLLCRLDLSRNRDAADRQQGSSYKRESSHVNCHSQHEDRTLTGNEYPSDSTRIQTANLRRFLQEANIVRAQSGDAGSRPATRSAHSLRPMAERGLHYAAGKALVSALPGDLQHGNNGADAPRIRKNVFGMPRIAPMPRNSALPPHVSLACAVLRGPGLAQSYTDADVPIGDQIGSLDLGERPLENRLSRLSPTTQVQPFRNDTRLLTLTEN